MRWRRTDEKIALRISFSWISARIWKRTESSTVRQFWKTQSQYFFVTTNNHRPCAVVSDVRSFDEYFDNATTPHSLPDNNRRCWSRAFIVAVLQMWIDFSSSSSFSTAVFLVIFFLFFDKKKKAKKKKKTQKKLSWILSWILKYANLTNDQYWIAQQSIIVLRVAFHRFGKRFLWMFLQAGFQSVENRLTESNVSIFLCAFRLNQFWLQSELSVCRHSNVYLSANSIRQISFLTLSRLSIAWQQTARTIDFFFFFLFFAINFSSFPSFISCAF